MRGVIVCKRLTGGYHGCQAAFHIGSAAAIQHSVGYRRLKRIGAPLIQWPGGDDIGMAGKRQQWTVLATSCPEVADFTKGHGLDGKTDFLQSVTHQLLATLVIGCHGCAADQLFG